VLHEIQVLFLPFLACLVLTGIHVYLGIHVISRKVIFVDLALAQIAALGATVAFLAGYDPRTPGAYWFSLAFAILAAVIFALTRTRSEVIPQEAVIGLAYATASAAAILMADISPHGAEHLRDLLAGSIVWVTPEQILKTFVFYTVIGLFHWRFREKFLLISLHPEEAYARGVHVRLWDFWFYLSFGVVITSSVQIAGVLLVFCYLVAPSVFAVMFFDDLKRRLVTGWIMATLVSAIGLLFSYDRPSGPTIMVAFALTLALGGVGRAVTRGARPYRGLALTAAAGAAVLLGGWALARVSSTPQAFAPAVLARSAPAEAPGEGAGHAHRDAEAEHELTGEIDELRAALRDTHENVRVRAVKELARTGDPRVLPDLVDALHDQAAAVRETAAVLIADTGSGSALPALKHGLRNLDEDEWVRLRIAEAVVRLGDADGFPVLLELAREGAAPLTRLEAIQVFIRLGGLATAPSADPASPEFAATLKAAGDWWRAHRDRLEFDPGAGRFRARR
jgi:zinc/manganese transport system permease protein